MSDLLHFGYGMLEAGTNMKLVHPLLAIVALILPTAAIAQPQGNLPNTIVSQDGIEDSADGAGIQTDELGAPIVLAQAVIVGPRGRVVVGPRGRGPRGRVVVGPRGRVFAYRGRDYEVIRRPRYVYPRGYGYRRWRAGQYLPLALLAAPLAFVGYEALGLQAPPPGYRWVRYGPDVVLVNERSRVIEDVAYGAFEDED